MDEAAQRELKDRFIRLTILLNAIMILMAIAVILFFRFPSLAGRVGMVVFLAAAAGLFLYFTRIYRKTKQWLDEEHRKTSTGSPESGDLREGTGDEGQVGVASHR